MYLQKKNISSEIERNGFNEISLYIENIFSIAAAANYKFIALIINI